MSRARKRIEKAVESRGFHVLDMEWEHPYYAGEKMGEAGGWTVVVDRRYDEHTWPGDDVHGLSVEEVLADIDWSLRPTEPCTCYPDDRRGRHPLVRIKGDPEHPLHEPGCQWRIDYLLRYWEGS